MKTELRKKGLIVNEDVKTVEIDPIEQNQTEPRIKFTERTHYLRYNGMENL